MLCVGSYLHPYWGRIHPNQKTPRLSISMHLAPLHPKIGKHHTPKQKIGISLSVCDLGPLRHYFPNGLKKSKTFVFASFAMYSIKRYKKIYVVCSGRGNLAAVFSAYLSSSAFLIRVKKNYSLTCFKEIAYLWNPALCCINSTIEQIISYHISSARRRNFCSNISFGGWCKRLGERTPAALSASRMYSDTAATRRNRCVRRQQRWT